MTRRHLRTVQQNSGTMFNENVVSSFLRWDFRGAISPLSVQFMERTACSPVVHYTQRLPLIFTSFLRTSNTPSATWIVCLLPAHILNIIVPSALHVTCHCHCHCHVVTHWLIGYRVTADRALYWPRNCAHQRGLECIRHCRCMRVRL
jgi:hypothetical protein